MARLYAWLPALEPDESHDDVRKELVMLVDDVLRSSAFHDEVVLPILRPLVTKHTSLAFEVVDRLNVDFRRDHVRGQLLQELASDPDSAGNTELLVEQLSRVSDPRVRSSTLILVLALATRRGNAGVAVARTMWQHAKQLTSASDRVMAFAHIYRALAESKESTSAKDELRSAVDAALIANDSALTVFNAVQEIAAVDRPTAEQMVRKVRERDSGMVPPSALTGFILATRLACRAMRGVFASSHGFGMELERVLDMCARIPQLLARVVALSDLCFAATVEGRTEAADTVYERLWSSLEEAKSESLDRYWRCLAVGGWSVFSRHERAFTAALEGIPAPERERIVRDTVLTILRGVPPMEPCADRGDLGAELSVRVARVGRHRPRMVKKPCVPGYNRANRPRLDP